MEAISQIHLVTQVLRAQPHQSCERRQSWRHSTFRNPGLAHAFIEAFASCEIDWTVACDTRTEASDGEGGIDRESGLHASSRFIELAA